MSGRRRALVLAVLTVFATAGCNLDPRTATLPGGTATGADGYTVTAIFSSANNLVPNSEVQYKDVRIGTIRSIKLDRHTWRAVVTMSVKKSVPLPANVRASVGQKSLLGAEFVQLDRPAVPVGRLAHHDVIPLARTSRYPETEEVLSAVSLLLNDGGLAQLKTITSEVNQALAGHEDTARDVLAQLSTFVSKLDGQKQQLIDSVAALNRLAAQLADDRDTVTRALTHITPAVATLNREKTSLTRALAAMNRLSVVTTQVLQRNRAGLTANLAQLRPVLTGLVAAGKALPDSLPLFVSFPFPITTLDNAVKGDYMNLFVTVDLSLQSLQDDFLKQIPILGSLPLSTIGQAKNPLTAPLRSAGVG